MIPIIKDSQEYKDWLKKRNEKELERRTKKREALRAARTYENEYNRKLKSSPYYNKKTEYFDFKVPFVFSFIKNPEETATFFANLISFITNENNYGKRLFIDISYVSELTIDALMYLLAIVNNLREKFKKCSISGNSPSNPEIKKRFVESGFYHFVRYQGKEPLTRNVDNIQIVSGENSNTGLAKRISDFVCSKAGVPHKCCSFLYCMIIELMSNTHKHAYNEKNNILNPHWYCFAEYDGHKTISFIFMDTGEGIPSTVRKNFSEKLDLLGVKGENKYVISALNGEFRTSTKKYYRGKGLPRIRDFCSNGYIHDMRIITNRADVTVHTDTLEGKDLSIPITGTLYYWKVDIDNLKGEI